MRLIRKLPVIKIFFDRIDFYKGQINKLEKEVINLEAELNKQKHIQKFKDGKKINIVFVCHRPQVWNTLNSLFESCINDEDFNVTIVAIPIKKQILKIDFNHEIYETEGAEEYWKDFPCKVINGYDYQSHEWFDLRGLDPDYVFFQQPYNIAKCDLYKSWNVSRYATICYTSYYYTISSSDIKECMPEDFIRNVSLCFLQNNLEYTCFNNKFDVNIYPATKRFLVGCPRFDELSLYKNMKSNLWKLSKEKSFRVVWTPRWTTNENTCHFFDYKDKFVSYCNEHNDIDFVFRPHPQAKLNYAAENNFSIKDFENYVNIYKSSKNMNIDNSVDFIPLFYSADVLISDYSSVIPEFFLTGKPVIYCRKKNATCMIEGNWTSGLYFANNWNELESILENLRKGCDPLLEVRKRLIRTEFGISEKGAGVTIKDLIKKDYRGE